MDETRHTQARRRRQLIRGPAHAWLSVIALVALALAGCASGSARPHPTATVPAPTITPLPASPLTWQPATLPNGFTAEHPATNVLVVAPSDGATAYACFEPAGTVTPTPQLWATHDRAATWAPLTLPTTLAGVGWCSLLVDQSNPRLLVAGVSALAPGIADRYSVSLDGGASWQDLPVPAGGSLIKVASDTHGATYALEDIAAVAGTTSSLIVSTDRLHSWRPADKGVALAGTGVTDFAVNAATGALLAQVGSLAPISATPTATMTVTPATTTISPTGAATPTPSLPQPVLWLSADGGAQWLRLSAPIAERIVTQTLTSGSVWRVCATATDPTGASPNQLACSADGGKTWRTQPALSIPYTCTICTIPVGSQSQRVAPATLFALPSDGAALAISPDWYGAKSEIKGYGVYRLTPGAIQWQSLGPAPQPGIQAGAVSGGAVLWALPTTAANVDPQGRVFIATYP